MATATARYVQAVEGTGARILDTRKTTPGLRALEKQAVLDGGGVSHRGGLYDAILVKENHAALAGGIVPAARAALAAGEGANFVELEVESLEELDQALAEGVDRVLLDNMGPDVLREAVARCGGPRQPRGLGRHHAGHHPRGGRDRRGLHLGRAR